MPTTEIKFDNQKAIQALEKIENLIKTYQTKQSPLWDKKLQKDIDEFNKEVENTPIFIRASYRKEPTINDSSIFAEKQITDNTYIIVRLFSNNISIFLQERNSIYAKADFDFSSPAVLEINVDYDNINTLIWSIIDISFKKYQGYSKNFTALKKLLSTKT